MKTNQSRWVLAACFAVALAGVGCGDDDPVDPVAGSGGGGGGGVTAGTGGASGRGAGTGGGGSGTGGVMQCVTATVAKITAARMTCATCVCTKGTALATACANSANCWPLLSCVVASGCAATDTNCITAACATTLDGAAAATPFGTPIVRGMCSAECETSSGDAGADDAGI